MKTLSCCTGVVLALSVFGCAAASDFDSIEGEETVGSVEEGLSTPIFEHVEQSGSGSVLLECPTNRFLLGTAGQVPASPALMTIDPQGGTNPTRLFVSSGASAGTHTAEGVCSNARGQEFTGSSTTGAKTVQCPDGMIAVGGGGDCDNSGRLYRSRPSPDGDGSTPTGWAAACTSGTVDTYAICVDPDATFDFTACHTQRVDGSGTVSVNCPANFAAVSAGGYCGNDKALFSLNLNPDLSGARVGCQGLSPSTPVHAYAVCCG